MNNKKKIEILFILIVLILSVCTGFILKEFINKKDNKTIESNSVDEVIDTVINTDDDDTKITWSDYEDTYYELSKSITITSEGIYNLTGTIDNGLITINTSGNVKLVLNNVSITNSSGPAIYIINASDVVIELVDGTTNYLEDGTTYSGYEDGEVGVILSHDDLTLQGTGSLIIKANNEDGIVSKDDLKIIDGNYTITSKDDGIRGKDSVYIENGTFIINAGGDGIKATNDTDSDKGFILIKDGTFEINADLDGIQAETKLVIEDGDFNITTGEGSNNTSTNSNWGMWGNNKSNSNSNSAKGLKSGDNLVIEKGNITINSSDDAIHSNNYVGIKNGNINITSGDDGIHADSELIVDDGTITITKSYEGLEASKVTINNGNISIIASDDGINVAGGADQSSQQGRPGANNYSNNSNNILTINDGTIYVNSSGDGLDANGSIYINGGNINVDGPTNNGNGALDYDKEFVVNGGTLLAGGSSGMAQNISSNSKIYGVLIGFSTTYSSNDEIKIVDSNNNTITTYSSDKSYTSLVYASDALKKGETYKVLVNGTVYQTFTISNIATTVGNISGNGGMVPGGNMNDRGPRQR